MIPELIAGLGAPGLGAAFWAGAREGRLVLTQCAACGRFEHPPRHVCIHCMSPEVRPVVVSGVGRVDTFTIVRRALMPGLGHAIPYVLALVALREPLRITSLIRDCEPDAVHIGMEVQVAFEPVGEDGFMLPVFAPQRP